MKLKTKYLNQQESINSHSLILMTKIQKLELDPTPDDITNYICSICGTVILESMYVRNAYFFKNGKNADLSCNQILMQNTLK